MFFGNCKPYGQPAVAKSDTVATEPRAHDWWDEHDHGPGAFTAKDLEMLKERNLHVDPHTSFVYDHTGHRVAPGHVAHILGEARQMSPGGDVAAVDKIADVSPIGSTFNLRDIVGKAPGES